MLVLLDLSVTLNTFDSILIKRPEKCVWLCSSAHAYLLLWRDAIFVCLLGTLRSFKQPFIIEVTPMVERVRSVLSLLDAEKPSILPVKPFKFSSHWFTKTKKTQRKNKINWVEMLLPKFPKMKELIVFHFPPVLRQIHGLLVSLRNDYKKIILYL